MKNKKLFSSLLVAACSGAVFYFCRLHYVASNRDISIPVQFLRSDVPVVCVQIEGKTIPLKFDMGLKFPLVICEQDFQNFQFKHQEDTVEWRDWKGDHFQARACQLPKVSLNGFELENVLAQIDDGSCKKNYVSAADTNKKEYIGSLGRPILEYSNVLLDFPNGLIRLVENVEQLKNMRLIKVPFTIGRTGCIIQVKTDFGTLRLSIDTGATRTAIRRKNVIDAPIYQDSLGLSRCTTGLFEIEGEHFGTIDMTLLDISDELHEIDGVLGMDFLRCHTVFIDYKNKLIWIQKNEKN